MEPHYTDSLVTLYHADALELLKELPDKSVHSVVTDPPYGLEFLGKEWDTFAPVEMVKRSGWDTADSSAKITEKKEHSAVGRVAYHSRRSTYQCTACGKRDGFRNEHDCPGDWDHVWTDEQPVESMTFQAWCEAWTKECFRILKPGGYMLAFGGSRTWHRLAVAVENSGFEIRDSIAWLYLSGFPKSMNVSKAIDKSAGFVGEVVGTETIDAGIQGGNLQTGRKRDLQEREIRSFSEQAQKWAGWGTALKPAFEPIVVARKPLAGTVAQNLAEHETGAINIDASRVGETDKFPPNIILDDAQAAELDRVTGGNGSDNFPVFRYEAKPATYERPDIDGFTHPTVKPLDLMRWLVRLVTPPNGVVLEPFAGSGTTLEACLVEGLHVIGIERDPDYLPLILQRIRKPIQQSLFGDLELEQ